MTMKYLLKTKLICTIILLTFCTTIFAYTKDRVYKITILHTNDHHGRFWKNRNNEYGMSARKTLVDRIRKEVKANNGYLLLLSGGDINTGIPESDLQDAEPDFKGMRKLGYDAMVLGNHEFDNSLSILKKQSKWSKFPFLAANVVYAKNSKTIFKPYIVKKHKGLKIAILGLTTEDTEIIGNPEFLKGIKFLPAIEVAQKIVPKLKKKNDIVIGLTHLGYHDGEHGANAPGDVTLARTVSGIDVIVGGHTHTPIFEPAIENDTIILQAYEWGKYVGRLDLEFLNGELKMKNYRLIPVNLTKKVKDDDGNSKRVFIEKEIPEDKKMKDFLEPFYAKGQENLQKVIGKTNGIFVGERKFVRFQETNLGNLISIAQMSKTNSELAVMNSGGIRDDLPKGEITYKDVLIVQPFGNTLCTVTLTGKELKDYLQVVGNKQKGTGAFPQFSGVELYFEKDSLKKLKVAGKLVSDNKQYKLSLNSYIASGGDGYPKVTEHPTFVNTGYVDADMLQEYISKQSPLKISNYKPTGDLIRD